VALSPYLVFKLLWKLSQGLAIYNPYMPTFGKSFSLMIGSVSLSIPSFVIFGESLLYSDRLFASGHPA